MAGPTWCAVRASAVASSTWAAWAWPPCHARTSSVRNASPTDTPVSSASPQWALSIAALCPSVASSIMMPASISGHRLPNKGNRRNLCVLVTYATCVLLLQTMLGTRLLECHPSLVACGVPLPTTLVKDVWLQGLKKSPKAATSAPNTFSYQRIYLITSMLIGVSVAQRAGHCFSVINVLLPSMLNV